MTSKLIKDGKVAVLVSYGYGAGWSTWNLKYGDKMVMDGEIAQLILDNKRNEAEELAEKKYPDVYLGGLADVEIEWVLEGTKFIIEEYDGSENLQILDRLSYFVA